MAIAFRAAQSNENIGGSPVQESFTTVTGDTHLIVGAATRTTSGTIDAATFNGVSMTLLGSVNQSSYKLYLFGLINPAIGSYNITFTLTGETNISYSAAAYTGAPTELNLQSLATNSTASGASLTVSNTAPTGWNILVARSNKSGGSTIAASTGSTSRSISTSGDGSIGIFDSNATVSGAQSMVVTATSGSLIVGAMATLSNTVINQSDTNSTTDTITGTGNIWFYTQSDTNTTTDIVRGRFEFSTEAKSATPTWINEEKS